MSMPTFEPIPGVRVFKPGEIILVSVDNISRMFIVRKDNPDKLYEFPLSDAISGENVDINSLEESDYTLTPPDYTDIINNALDSIYCECLKCGTTANSAYNVEISILNQVVKRNVIGMLGKAETIDISDINLCDVAKFILKVNDDLSACLASLSESSDHENFVETKEFLSNVLSCVDKLPGCTLHDNSEGLDETTILVIGIKMTLTKVNDKLNFNKLLFLLNLVMKKCDELKSVK